MPFFTVEPNHFYWRLLGASAGGDRCPVSETEWITDPTFPSVHVTTSFYISIVKRWLARVKQVIMVGDAAISIGTNIFRFFDFAVNCGEN